MGCAPWSRKEDKKPERADETKKPVVIFVQGPPGIPEPVCDCLVYALQSNGPFKFTWKIDCKSLLDKCEKEGKQVSSEVLVGLLEKELLKKNGWNMLVSGFPRNMEDFETWRKVMGDKVVTAPPVTLWRACTKDHTKLLKEEKEKERQELEDRFKRNTQKTEDEFKRLYDAYNKETIPALEKLNEFCENEMNMFPASCVISTTVPKFKMYEPHVMVSIGSQQFHNLMHFLREAPKMAQAQIKQSEDGKQNEE